MAVAEKTVWTSSEITSLLEHLTDRNAYTILDSKRQRNMELFEDVAKAMDCGKSPQQCRTKFKAMKSKYLECKTAAKKSGTTY